MSSLYRLENVSKNYKGTDEDLNILRGINLEVPKGQALGIVGASGSGKSTLLHLMGALDKPTSGKIFFRDRELASLSLAEQASFRNRSLGFVFQFHHLLPEFSALENVAMPGLIAGLSERSMHQEAEKLLKRVGLEERMNAIPSTLSGGERQRAAIARALLMKPDVILADEPTGNLDEKTGAQVAALLRELNRELGMTLVIVTHNMEIAADLDKVLELRAGVLYEKNIH